MTDRIAVALLTPVRWAPPGVDPYEFRRALAEDVVDLLASLAEVTPAIAAVPADRPLAEEIAWPGMPVYELPVATPRAALDVAAEQGHTYGVVVAGDAPDLPGLLVGKLLAPLTTRTVAVAPADGGGLLGLASRLPAPDWLPATDLADPVRTDLPVMVVRRAAPRPGLVAATPSWHRLRTPEDLRRLDPHLEGWDNTRALLS